MTAYCIRDREGGNVIDTYDTLEEAVFALASFEEEDMENNDFEPDFYEVCAQVGEYWEPIPAEELML